MSTEHPGYEVEVTQSGVVVSMAPRAQTGLAPADFEDRQLAVDAVSETAYYAAFAGGNLERVVSATVADRKTVAALVGNWVAQGFTVQSLSRKELLKQLRKVEAAAKDAGDGAATTTPSAPPPAGAQSTDLPQGTAGAKTHEEPPVGPAAAHAASALDQPPASASLGGATLFSLGEERERTQQ